MSFTEKVTGLTSKRVRKLEDPDAPTAFQTMGGWAPADAASGTPEESEMSARRAGADALVQLYKQQGRIS